MQSKENKQKRADSNTNQQNLVAKGTTIESDQTHIVISEAQWQQIESAINQPANVLPKLKEKLSKLEQASLSAWFKD